MNICLRKNAKQTIFYTISFFIYLFYINNLLKVCKYDLLFLYCVEINRNLSFVKYKDPFL